MVSEELIGADEQRRLLDLARRALEARVRGTTPPAVETDADDPRRGAFVSIFRRGELRGCLGRLKSNLPIRRIVFQLAQAVADSDPRFEKVVVSELNEIGFEISVLTREREVTSVDEIEVGRHGLIVEHGTSRGLLLPQVPIEQGWDRDTFLDHTCLKAGLDAGAWRRGARIFIFEAQVFGEREREHEHERKREPRT
jgi:AmmeMemoRadiSam system protein A